MTHIKGGDFPGLSIPHRVERVEVESPIMERSENLKNTRVLIIFCLDIKRHSDMLDLFLDSRLLLSMSL